MSEYSKLKVSLIGAGKMGTFHARKIALHPMVRFMGVFDQNQEAAAALASQFPRCQTFSSLEELLNNSEAVLLVAATAAHFDLANQIIAKGIPLLVEKPLAATSEQANKLVEAAEAKNLVLAVGHIERYNPAFTVLTEYLHKQLLLKLEFRRCSPYPDRMQNDSVVFDMMIHDLDLALSLSHGSAVVKVEATGKKTKSKLYDIVKAKVVFENGLVTEFEANRDNPDRIRTIEALCEDNVFQVDLIAKTLTPNISDIPIKTLDQIETEQRNFVAAVRNKRI